MVTWKDNITLHVHSYDFFFCNREAWFTLQKEKRKMKASGTSRMSRIHELRWRIRKAVDETTHEGNSKSVPRNDWKKETTGVELDVYGKIILKLILTLWRLTTPIGVVPHR